MIHLGTELGHGADGVGVDTPVAPEEVAGALPEDSAALEMVEVAVSVIVETVLVTVVMALPLEITTAVTGHVVTVAQVTMVVVLSGTEIGPDGFGATSDGP